MNKITSFLYKNGFIIFLSLVAVAFIFSLLLCSFLGTFIDIVWINSLKSPMLFFWLAILFVLTLLYGLLRKPQKEAMSKFLTPFQKKGKELFFGINAIVCVICVGAIVIHFFYHKTNGIDEFSFFNLTSFLLCLFSIILTSRVYFEIEKEKTNTLDEYLERLTDIIINSRGKDQILIIAPTIILGQAHKNKDYIKDEYLQEIFRFLKIGNITFALLESEISESLKFNIERSSDGENSTMVYKTNISITKKSLFDYHFETWKLYAKDQDEMGKYRIKH